MSGKERQKERHRCDACGKRRTGSWVGNIYFPTWPPGRYWLCDACRDRKRRAGIGPYK